jgi:hypothetical protein
MNYIDPSDWMHGSIIQHKNEESNNHQILLMLPKTVDYLIC